MEGCFRCHFRLWDFTCEPRRIRTFKLCVIGSHTHFGTAISITRKRTVESAERLVE